MTLTKLLKDRAPRVMDFIDLVWPSVLESPTKLLFLINGPDCLMEQPAYRYVIYHFHQKTSYLELPVLGSSDKLDTMLYTVEYFNDLIARNKVNVYIVDDNGNRTCCYESFLPCNNRQDSKVVDYVESDVFLFNRFMMVV